MAVARRCSNCDISYPSDKKTCLVETCGRELWTAAREVHDSDWQDKVSRLNKRHRPGQPIPNAHCKVVPYDDRLFVADENLRAAGYHDIESGSIVQIEGRYYEVFGSISDTETTGWWIELIRTLDPYPELPVLSEHEYAELERKRGIR